MLFVDKIRAENYTSPSLPFIFPNANGTDGAITVAGGVVTIASSGIKTTSTIVGASITISGASHAANNGTFPITALVAGTATIANPNAVTGDTGATWQCHLTVLQLACMRDNSGLFGAVSAAGQTPNLQAFEFARHDTEDLSIPITAGVGPFTREICSQAGGTITADCADGTTQKSATLVAGKPYPVAVSKFYAVAGNATDIEVLL